MTISFQKSSSFYYLYFGFKKKQFNGCGLLCIAFVLGILYNLIWFEFRILFIFSCSITDPLFSLFGRSVLSRRWGCRVEWVTSESLSCISVTSRSLSCISMKVFAFALVHLFISSFVYIPPDGVLKIVYLWSEVFNSFSH